jgi:hypothetical protein
MNLYKVWYQLPMHETEDTFYYAPAWSASHIHAETLDEAKSRVNALIEKYKEKLDEIGFALRNVEQERLTDFATVLGGMIESKE